jgi:hypothetical protein
LLLSWFYGVALRYISTNVFVGSRDTKGKPVGKTEARQLILSNHRVPGEIKQRGRNSRRGCQRTFGFNTEQDEG